MQASSFFAKAAQLAPGLTEAHRELGQMAKQSQDWSTAVREFEAVLAWNSEDAGAHYDLAEGLKASGRLEDGARELQIAQRLNPALGAHR